MSGQTGTDRPDLVARVFDMELKERLKDITLKNIFGKIIAFVYTIELQKRGLPHAHILLILHPSCKPIAICMSKQQFFPRQQDQNCTKLLPNI